MTLDTEMYVKIFKEYASQNPEKFKSAKGQGGWHQDINEIILFAKEFSARSSSVAGFSKRFG